MTTSAHRYGSNGLAKSLREPEDKPPVTEAHRREAFNQMKWQGRSYADTMADPVYARIVEIRATLIRNREYWAAKGVKPTPPGAPEPQAPRTQHNFTTYPRTPRIF
ncbi:MAG: hypothetical protein RL375_776 [Pseudomonadota bacterium]|jgi:hypothetical protein